MTYCEYLNTITGEQLQLHKEYHDNHYGFPLENDDQLFERMMFEINQAGLNWILILRKQHNFRKAYDNFSIDKISEYNDVDILRLMNDPGIIRNRLKINAAIENAKVIKQIIKESGSFSKWLDNNSMTLVSLEEWTKIFKKTFRFTGSEIVNEFLMSTGYLPGAHNPDCPIYELIIKIKIENEKKGERD
jgi:DNA-3-methyladenine glycosylase I